MSATKLYLPNADEYRETLGLSLCSPLVYKSGQVKASSFHPSVNYNTWTLPLIMSIPTTQQALAIPAYLEPYTLITRPVPKPGKGDVLVRVEATGLNPAENHVKQATTWVIREYPALTGTDGAGVVVDKGEDVKEFEVGDRVLFQGELIRVCWLLRFSLQRLAPGWFDPDRSTYQQFTLAYADKIAKVYLFTLPSMPVYTSP